MKNSNLTDEPLWSIFLRGQIQQPWSIYISMEPAPRVLEKTWQTAQMLRLSAREVRALARAAAERARKARNRVRRLNSGVERAIGPTEIQRRITLRDEALDALKQSLRDLQSLRLVSPDDIEVAKLTADIRKTLERVV